MRFVVLLLVLVASVVLAVSGWALKIRFDQGSHTRVAICEGMNQLRVILHDEHQRKLETTKAYLRDHPNGTPSIPRALLLQAILDEAKIVRETEPAVCR